MVHTRPTRGKRFVLHTDASKVGTAGVLCQEEPDEMRHVVSFDSKKFRSAELNNHVNEAE